MIAVGWWFGVAIAGEVPPPSFGVNLSVDAGGRLVVGHVLCDTAKLKALGIELWDEQVHRVEPQVPLMHGLRVVGLPAGERVVDQAIQGLLLFDANGDNYLDALDPAFGALALFEDRNGDQRIQAGEVQTLSALGVESISKFGSVRMKAR
ncbi:MAG: hypothetical protein ABMB14_37195 [Myxococcota bacterium]